MKQEQIDEIYECIKYNTGSYDDDAKSCAEILYNYLGYRKYEWISIEDRLPEGTGHYWVVLDNDEVHVAFYSNRTGFMRDVDGVVMKRIEMSIVYWMPYIVPTPPTEKEN